MKYKIVEQTESDVQIFCLYDDNTFTLLDLVAGRELEEILQDAYILTKNKENRQAYTGQEIKDLKDYVAKPRVARLEADFYNLTGKVYDQHGDILDAPISFEIEGTDKVKIEDGKLIEEEVDKETSYFLIARAEELEEKQERKLYPRQEEPQPKPDMTAILVKEVANLKIKLMQLEGGSK